MDEKGRKCPLPPLTMKQRESTPHSKERRVGRTRKGQVFTAIPLQRAIYFFLNYFNRILKLIILYLKMTWRQWGKSAINHGTRGVTAQTEENNPPQDESDVEIF